MSGSFLITSCGTGIGKTHVTAMLTRQLRTTGKSVVALKPVISGYDEADGLSDTALLLAAQGLVNNNDYINHISPYRFTAPLAPNMAAKLEGRKLSLVDVLEFCTKPRSEEIILIEGVGGIMAPLTDEATMLDLAAELGFPIIMVVGSYLGAISHALTACEVLRAKGLTLQALIISESEDSSVDFAQSCLTLRQFVRYASHIVSLARTENKDLTGVVA